MFSLEFILVMCSSCVMVSLHSKVSAHDCVFDYNLSTDYQEVVEQKGIVLVNYNTGNTGLDWTVANA